MSTTVQKRAMKADEKKIEKKKEKRKGLGGLSREKKALLKVGY